MSKRTSTHRVRKHRALAALKDLITSFQNENESNQDEETSFAEEVGTSDNLLNVLIKDETSIDETEPDGEYSSFDDESVDDVQVKQEPVEMNENVDRMEIEVQPQINESIFHVAVLKEIQSIKADIIDIKQDIKSILSLLETESTKKYHGEKPFEEEYQLKFPLETMQDLLDLDAKLKADERCCMRFKATLDRSIYQKIGTRKTLSNLIRKFLGRQLILNLTVIKKVPEKELFKDFYFCTCLIDVACNKLKISEKEVLSHIATGFANAKDIRKRTTAVSVQAD